MTHLSVVPEKTTEMLLACAANVVASNLKKEDNANGV